MKKVRLEKIDAHLKEELKNERFRRAYKIERARVTLVQKIAKS